VSQWRLLLTATAPAGAAEASAGNAGVQMGPAGAEAARQQRRRTARGGPGNVASRRLTPCWLLALAQGIWQRGPPQQQWFGAAGCLAAAVTQELRVAGELLLLLLSRLLLLLSRLLLLLSRLLLLLLLLLLHAALP
jgi:hypothetical protein